MQLSFSIIAIMLLLFCASCSRQEELASAAVAQDFQGRWKGNWSWDSTRSTSFELSNSQFKATGLPLLTGTGGIQTVSAEGRAEFESAYGSGSNPCLLLHFENPRQIVAVFILKDKQRLIYDFDVNFDRKIIFLKQ